MITKETQQLNSIETFYETKWSKQSVTTSDQAGKKFGSTKIIETSN